MFDTNEFRQLLATNSLQNRWGHRFLWWRIRVHGRLADDAGEYLFTVMSTRGLRSGTLWGDPSVAFAHHFDRRQRTLMITVRETFGGQSRTTTLAYALTPHGFQILPCGEADTPGDKSGMLPATTDKAR